MREGKNPPPATLSAVPASCSPASRPGSTPPIRPLTQPAERRTRGATRFEVRLARQLTGKNFCGIIIEGDLGCVSQDTRKAYAIPVACRPPPSKISSSRGGYPRISGESSPQLTRKNFCGIIITESERGRSHFQPMRQAMAASAEQTKSASLSNKAKQN